MLAIEPDRRPTIKQVLSAFPERDVTVYKVNTRGVVDRVIVRCNDNMPMSEFCARAGITSNQYILARDPSAATVFGCGIDRSVTVLESLSPSGGQTVLLKKLDGTHVALPFHENMEVVALCNYIQRRHGFFYEQHRLVFRGRQLDVNDYLSDYKVTRNSTVHLVGRLCG